MPCSHISNMAVCVYICSFVLSKCMNLYVHTYSSLLALAFEPHYLRAKHYMYIRIYVYFLCVCVYVGMAGHSH